LSTTGFTQADRRVCYTGKPRCYRVTLTLFTVWPYFQL